MKKKSPPYAFIGALLLGAILVYCLYLWKQDQDQKLAAAADAATGPLQKEINDLKASHVSVVSTPTNMRNVLYATQPVEPGVRISPAFYEKKLTPKDILPDAYTDESDIVGWYAVRKIEKGDPLTPRNIGKSLPYMSMRITPGMRAITLAVFNAENNYTGGFIVDGDRVDLLYTPKSLDEKFILNTQLIMQNLNVLYVPGPTIKTEKTDGITPVPPPGDAIAVTFEVTPEQAEILAYMAAVKNGHFSMILRSRKDFSEINIKPFNPWEYNWLKLKKVQKTVDKSIDRVNELTQEIEAKEKAASAQGTTNETTTPTPPTGP